MSRLDDLILRRDEENQGGERVRLYSDEGNRVGAVRLDDDWHATGPYTFAAGVFEGLMASLPPV